LEGAFLGRSHRAKAGKAKLNAVISESRRILGIPEDYLLGIVPASDTGAVEMALWSLLGARGVDVLYWESFGKGWAADIRDQLKIEDLRIIEAGYGEMVDLGQVGADRDVVFTWNGTTSGARVPDGSWISAQREGLTICDATSAAFAMTLPWEKLDAVTWSWQKVLGGEAAHGMLALSPRAVSRLETYSPPWPLPKIFRLTKGGRLNRDIFQGATINTPSMLAAEDALAALHWAEEIGGLPALIARTDANLATVAAWVAQEDWIDFLVSDPRYRSPTSICLSVTDPWFRNLDADRQKSILKEMTGRLEAEGVAYDIASYRDAPPGLRLWGGATVEGSDMEALLPWLTWAYRCSRVEAGGS
jgi:phosphoserine aminotransferase